MIGTIDGDRLQALAAKLMDGHVTYHLNKKAHPLDIGPEKITQLDCSGFVQYVIYKTTSLVVPSGSWHQNHDWCKPRQTRVDYKSSAGLTDCVLRIAFMEAAPKQGRHYGHVWLILNAFTLESHGGVGPDTRRWDDEKLLPHVSDCYELAYVLAPSTNSQWLQTVLV